MPTAALLRHILFAVLVLSAVELPELQAQSSLIPLPARRDMVFDPAGGILYITTHDGWVRRYQIASGELEPGYHLGGHLNGADIAPNGSFLLVGQASTPGSTGTVHRLDLQTGSVTDIHYPLVHLEVGTWDVAIGPGGMALFTTGGSAAGPVRQIDLATNQVTKRGDTPGSTVGFEPGSLWVTGGTQIQRSASRSRFYFLEPNSSSGSAFTYDALSDSFGVSVEANMYFSFASAAVNRDGTLLATLADIQSNLPTAVPRVAIDTAPHFDVVRSVIAGDSGMAFDAVADRLYVVSSSSSEIIAYDTQTWVEKFRLTIGEPISRGAVHFGPGTLVASPDGRHLALATASGVRVFAIPATPVPSPPPAADLSARRDMVFDHAGQFLYVTTSRGLLLRHELATGVVEVVADLGGQLNGIDIAPDDSFLLVAHGHGGLAKANVYRVDLPTGAVTNIQFPRIRSDSGTWDVAIAANARGFVTARIPAGFSATTVMREIDLRSNTVSIRSDIPFPINGPGILYPEMMQETHVHRSADRTRLYFLGPNRDDGPIFTYSAHTNTFGPFRRSHSFLDWASAAVNRDGSLLATRHGHPNRASLDTAADFRLIQTFRFDGGVAFDAVRDILYGVDTVAGAIIAYDTGTTAELFRLPLPESVPRPDRQFGRGLLVASADGKRLAISTTSGVRVIDIPADPPPTTPAIPLFGIPRDFLFDHGGRYLYITTTDGLVWPFNLASSQLETPYDLGGSVIGFDIAPDDSYLLVAQAQLGLAQGRFQRVDLLTRAITHIAFDYSTGLQPYDVAIAANGLAFGTMGRDSYSGYSQIYQINLAASTIAPRASPNFSGVSNRTLVHRSADRRRLAFATQGSPETVTIYHAESDSFYAATRPIRSSQTALSRDGSLLGEFYDGKAHLFALPGFTTAHVFAGLQAGIAFDATRDVFYGINATTDEIIGYDTNHFGETFRLAIGEDIPSFLISGSFDVGTFVASPDGRHLAYRTPTALRIFDIAAGNVTAISTVPRLANISTRAAVGVDDEVTIGGFIIRGTQPKKVVVRAVGPSLGRFGLAGALQDPTLHLHDSAGVEFASNQDWQDAQGAEIASTGLAPQDPREAALVLTLNPGPYTAIMRGNHRTTGLGLVEIFDVDAGAPAARLENISTRGKVGTGDQVMIAGLIMRQAGEYMGGHAVRSKRVLIRALGPSLAAAGVPNVLQDPTVTLIDSNGTAVRSSDDWALFQRTEIEALGLAPSHPRESAILTTLDPGNYTAIVQGNHGTTGIALVEVYAVD